MPRGTSRSGRSRRRDQAEHDHDQHPRPVGEPAAGEVVDEPRDDQQRERDHDRLPRLEVGDRRVDQAQPRVCVIDDAEEREPGQPRPVRLPLVPVERLRQVQRGDPELVDAVEAAAVDLPRLSADAFLTIMLLLGLVQVVVERDEVERGADPDDRRRRVEPAEDEIQPVGGVVG